MSKNKYYNQLLKNGYCIINHVFKKNYCDELIKKIEDLYTKKKNKRYDVDEGSMYGQEIIRDLVLRDPKTFLKLIDNKKIIKVLELIFKDLFILENIMASNSVNVKKNIRE